MTSFPFTGFLFLPLLTQYISRLCWTACRLSSLPGLSSLHCLFLLLLCPPFWQYQQLSLYRYTPAGSVHTPCAIRESISLSLPRIFAWSRNRMWDWYISPAMPFPLIFFAKILQTEYMTKESTNFFSTCLGSTMAAASSRSASVSRRKSGQWRSGNIMRIKAMDAHALSLDVLSERCCP